MSASQAFQESSFKYFTVATNELVRITGNNHHLSLMGVTRHVLFETIFITTLLGAYLTIPT
jgi:hypothetical protein